VKERPIVFATEMMRAILAGEKSETRRIPSAHNALWKPGDVLWVRECIDARGAPAVYRADGRPVPGGARHLARRVYSSRFMPRWACRQRLRIVEVWREPLQDITPEGAVAEGIGHWTGTIENDFIAVHLSAFPLEAFQAYWDHLSAGRGYAWESNPLVVVCQFTPLRGEVR